MPPLLLALRYVAGRRSGRSARARLVTGAAMVCSMLRIIELCQTFPA
jgi:hypothetical protein